MSIRNSDKQKLIDGLFVGLGEAVFGLNGPFLFQRFGLNVPEAAATGTLAGAVVGVGLAHLLVRRAANQDAVEPGKILPMDDLSTGARRDTQRKGVSSEDEATELGIERALGLWAHDGADIRVEVHGQKVVLQGTVHSWEEEAEAERIAFDTPGIQKVENRLDVVM